MTSGVFKTFPVSKIWVNREARQRKEITEDEIRELAGSISRTGLIHPPVIRQSGELIVGERRWRACQAIGWTNISVQFIEELSEPELKMIELEENTRRRDLTWHDLCRSVDEYHNLRKAEEPEWSVEDTANALGYGPRIVLDYLNVVKEMQRDARVAEAPKFSTARNIVKRTTERREASQREALNSALNGKEIEVPLINADFEEWSRDYTGPKFNMLFCDFPYGINADKHDQGAAPEHGGYKDTEDNYFNLLDILHDRLDRIVDPSAHLIFWFSLDFYARTRERLIRMGWRLDGRLLIWAKSDGTSILPDPNRGPRWGYETAFFGSRGDRKIVRPVMNWIAAPATKGFHMSEKPLEVCRHFLRMTTDEYTTFLDPTCGSGNSCIAARDLGAGHILGIERDKGFFEDASRNWKDNVE